MKPVRVSVMAAPFAWSWTVKILAGILALVKADVADAEMSCVLKENCLLPCSFQASNDSFIRWFQIDPRYADVHIYNNNTDELNSQNQHFRGRTSLFKDQISRGNASLQLTGVEVQDEGRYQCYTSTESATLKSFIILKVNAPVSKVDIKQEGNRITCSSEGIYPKPELTWSINPPSNVTFKNSTAVHQTEQQLYNINSSLIVSDSVTGLDYSCTISTDRSRRTVTLFKPNSQCLNDSDTETTIPCTSTNSSINGFSLIWRFNHTQVILNQTNVSYMVSVEWTQYVKSVSESGSLTLQDLSSNQEGTYTCELSNDEETNITNTCLRIVTRQGGLNVAWIIGLCLSPPLIVVVAFLLWCLYKRGEQENNQRQASNGRTHQETEHEDLTSENGATPHQNRNSTTNHLLQEHAEIETSL